MLYSVKVEGKNSSSNQHDLKDGDVLKAVADALRDDSVGYISITKTAQKVVFAEGPPENVMPADMPQKL